MSLVKPRSRIRSECCVRRCKYRGENLTYCNGCKRVYCTNCYETQATHQEDIERNTTHEKTDLKTADTILSLYTPQASVEEQETLHQVNIHSKWFGTIDDATVKKTYLHDFGGFKRIVYGSRMELHEQFPCLISFVGDTGAGKSTAINGVIKLPKNTTEVTPADIMSPVIGLSHQLDTPTSGDVHLFHDAETYHSYRPLLYADCEGLGGGNSIPAAKKYIKKLSKATREFRDVVGHKRREILTTRGIEKTQKWAVEELYPRILFSFSDVVCYVTRNPRKIATHIETLLSWANRALDKATNQPMLPYTVIVINALRFSENETPQEMFKNWWDVDQTTSNVLNNLKRLTDPVPHSGIISSLAKEWRNRGTRITSLQDLIQCYYRSFKIICIPDSLSHQHSLVIDQNRKLQDEIKKASEGSLRSRKESTFLMSAEELEYYFENAFDHFTTKSDEPFDFMSAALIRTPVTTTLKYHICKLIVYFMGWYPEKNGDQLFRSIAPWVASSLFLDSHRCRYPGRDVAKKIFKQYMCFCEEAQIEFYTRHWPCERKDQHGSRCVNVVSGHTSKGHQNSRGKLFGQEDPEFRSSFVINKKQAKDEFFEAIVSELELLIGELQKGLKGLSITDLEQERQTVAKIHMSALVGLLGSAPIDGKKPLVSHTTCFCCLTSTPEHKLYCGHIICQLCLEDFSSLPPNESYRGLRECPLCGKPADGWKLKVRPATAGLRILCLDGGGIRSIIQLLFLQELERIIDLNIPIQDFFDLIIGTSGGGIVASGIGLERLSVKDCITLFMNFAKQAFIKRPTVDWPLWGKIIMAQHHSFYKSKGLNQVLKKHFGQGHLFGSNVKVDTGIQQGPKIGLTATSSSGHAYLLANYNRSAPEEPPDQPRPYVFFRGEDQEAELKLWEALRATSAAPGYFKSFFHAATGHTFNDGALKCNNPVFVADKERKILWPSLAKRDPDILLSIGTGNDPSAQVSPTEPGPKSKQGPEGCFQRFKKIGLDAIKENMNCELMWADFINNLKVEPNDSERKQKYQRLNQEFKSSLPKLDGVDQMEFLMEKMAEDLPANPQVRKVANILTASLFHFKMELFDTTADGSWICFGKILCRLEPGSKALKSLYNRMRDYAHPLGSAMRPVFLIGESNGCHEDLGLSIPIDDLAKTVFKDLPLEFDVTISDHYKDKQISIYLSIWGDPLNAPLISGFPQKLDPATQSFIRRGSIRRRTSWN